MSDMTYIYTKEVFLYLITIIDLYDRKIIGWSLSDRMCIDQTSLPAWKMAIKTENLFILTWEIQYANRKFANTLEFYKITRSMSRTGNCRNAVVKSFFNL